MNQLHGGSLVRGHAVFGALVLGLSLAACEPVSRTQLPTMVAVVAGMKPEGSISLLVDLHAPRRRPTLRVAPGLVVYDGRRLFLVEPSKQQGAHEDLKIGLRLRELIGRRVEEANLGLPAQLGAQVRITEILDNHLVLQINDDLGLRSSRVDLLSFETEEVPSVQASRRYTHFGPGQGFSVELRADALVLNLPHQKENLAISLLKEVDSILSVRWITAPPVSEELEVAVDRVFKQAESIAAKGTSAFLDGDLSEWREDPAVAIRSLSQVLQGDDDWSGPRDGSFAIAARYDGAQLCAAVRVRDNEMLTGQDLLVLEVGGLRYEFPIGLPERERSEQGMRAIFTDQVSFGVGLEFCIDKSLWKARDGIVPFRAIYIDHDSGEEESVLATAPDVPWPSLAGIKLPGPGSRSAVPSW